MNNYTIGLDLGINNVGWSILDNDKKEIVKYGVRCFKASENAQDRRTSRNTRRRMKRKDTRIHDMKSILKAISFPSEITIDNKLIEKRYKGINCKIEKQDITNILCYMVSHRGYIPFGDEEVEFIDLNGSLPCEYYYKQFMKTGEYRASGKTVKNTENIKEIEVMLSVQSQYYKELDNEFVKVCVDIFKRKRKFWEGPGSVDSLTKFGRFKTQADVDEYLENKRINPNYEKYIFEDLIGECKIAIGEKCAPKINIYAEEFNLLNDFINISFKNIDGLSKQDYFYPKDGSYKISTLGLNAILNYCKETPTLTYVKVLKDVLGTTKENMIGNRVDKSGKPDFEILNNYRYVLKEIEKRNLSKVWTEDKETYNEIMKLMTLVPGVVELENMIKNNEVINYNFSSAEMNLLFDVFKKFKKDGKLSYHALSEKILKKANKHMINECLNFMQIRRKHNYDKEAKEYFIKKYKEFSGDKNYINPIFVDDIISSPQVKKSLRQSIRVINAIIKENNGLLPETIVVESTKEMNGKDKKAEIDREQRINESLRKNAKKELEAIFSDSDINETNIEKNMLYNETNGHCIYCNTPINRNSIYSMEIEHIIPRSKSFDDSFNNKALSCSHCNREKGNKTPHDYLKALNLYEEYKKRILENKNLSDAKKDNLLFEGNIDKYSIRFFNRNLRDTAYATTELIKQINLFNNFIKESGQKPIKTLSTPGQLTSKIRKQNKLDKDRDAGKYHHAVDASIVASIVTTDLGKLLIESQNSKEFWLKNKNKVIVDESKFKYFNIADTIDKIKTIDDTNTNYSYQLSKNPQGKLANANIYKLIKKEDNFYKIDQINNIYELDLKQKKTSDLLEELFNENSKNKTLLIFDNNINLFNKLKQIYLQYKDVKGNPFVNYCVEINNIEEGKFDYKQFGIRSSDKDGKVSPVVTRLRYYSIINEPFLLNKNSINKKDHTYIALDSLSQVCTRVYKDLDTKKFVFLPIYSVSVDLNTRKINEQNEFYLRFFNKYIGNSRVEHLVDLYTGNVLEVTKKEGLIKSEYSSFDKCENRIDLKNRKRITRSDKEFKVIHYDVLGNVKKTLTYRAD